MDIFLALQVLVLIVLLELIGMEHNVLEVMAINV
jgi:hypothetical protein